MTKTKKKNDISNFKTISNKKKTQTKEELLNKILELRELLASHELTNIELTTELNKKNKEIEHLQSLLNGAVPVIGQIEVGSEEAIAEMQLQKLRDAAMNRDLTLEEARKFEIFSKVKFNASKSKPIDVGYSKLPTNITKTKLLDIAKGSILKDNISTDE